MKPPESLRLRSLRAALELSQGEFAAFARVGRSTIARSELGTPLSSSTIASIAQGLRVDPMVLVGYFAGTTRLDEVLSLATLPAVGETKSEPSSEDVVAAGELSNVAAAVFRSGQYTLDALDAVRGWLREIESSGEASVLEDAEAAEHITEQLFEVASTTLGPRLTLAQALLRASVRLSYFVEALPDGVDPEFFVRQRRAKMHAAKLASTRERHSLLISTAKKIYEAMPEEERAKLGAPAARFVNGEMHDGDARWRTMRDAFVALGAKDVPF